MTTPVVQAPKPRSSGVTERRLIVLGSTGSIGTQTLEVVEHLNALADRGLAETRWRVVGLAAGRNHELLQRQAERFGVSNLALCASDAEGPGRPRLTLRSGPASCRFGPSSAEELVREVACDVVLAAMVGSAGLPATLAAVQLGRDVALANKETLVAAGALVIPAARASGSRLLPVDSEHCGVWECLHGCGGSAAQPPCPPMDCGDEVRRIVLTASGGPFRTWNKADIDAATPAQALKHPTWQMGKKVTIDSASLTNKALEIVEAHWLFGVPGEKIGVLVHPQSIVHALVEYADGNVMAQLAAPDMRTPIQYALTFPNRPAGIGRTLDWTRLASMEFFEPDMERFPALRGAYEVIASGGVSGAVFNAANERAVEHFLDGRIPFGRICELSLGALREVCGGSRTPLRSLADALDADAQARRAVDCALDGAALGLSVREGAKIVDR